MRRARNRRQRLRGLLSTWPPEHERTVLARPWAEYIDSCNCPYASSSLVYAAHCDSRHSPCTIHVALGTDIVHMHPHVSGAALGESSLIDFRILCRVIHGMQEGLWLNIGSAPSLMPEVYFLKAPFECAIFGADLSGLVTANLDERRNTARR